MLAGYTAVLASPGFVFLEEKPGRLDDYALATRCVSKRIEKAHLDCISW